MRARHFREPDDTRAAAAPPRLSSPSPHRCLPRRQHMIPILLWILGVPGLIIILLLLLGIIHL
jgi:hypothetical protein